MSATLYALAGNSIAFCVLEAILEVILSNDYAMENEEQVKWICETIGSKLNSEERPLSLRK